MKTIILVSSLFYLLGLKISNTIEVFKNNKNHETIIMEQPAVDKNETKNASFSKETSSSLNKPDSTNVSGSNQTLAPSIKE